MKAETAKLHKYEESLLLYYKKYLQKLEGLCGILIKKKGDQRKRSEVILIRFLNCFFLTKNEF